MSLLFSTLRTFVPRPQTQIQPVLSFARFRSQLAPRRVRYRKSHKGRVPVPTGGSTKGTTLAFGDYGLRVKGDGMRLTAKQLQSAEVVIKRKLKVIKTSQIWMRVFPDLPVCVKGNETRMGKGKGSFEYWACRVPTGKVVFEIGGGIREEIARDALRLAATKLPVLTEFISRSAGPKLGALDLPPVPPKPITGISSKIIRNPLEPLSVMKQESLKVPAGEVVV
ncbi:ribosomal protein L16p/L10e [Ceratobasidium sp. AG-Ba]|nr:ribosomal protein L16p/L10e [Ceratobasidium sp. AG-Ba]QRW10827.1 ribosomal protein L16p/L10e [Ceratobasidium sp. AG-Ba]